MSARVFLDATILAEVEELGASMVHREQGTFRGAERWATLWNSADGEFVSLNSPSGGSAARCGRSLAGHATDTAEAVEVTIAQDRRGALHVEVPLDDERLAGGQANGLRAGAYLAVVIGEVIV